jgi:hypothetical protein
MIIGAENLSPELQEQVEALRKKAAEQWTLRGLQKGVDMIKMTKNDAARSGLSETEIDELYKRALGEGE